MKKIGLTTPGFSASNDDWSIPAVLNSVRLLARDHDVHVFTLRYPHTTQQYEIFGATVHPLGVTHARAGLHRLTTIVRGVSSILRQGKFDVLHALWADEPGMVAALAGMLTRTPVVVSLMGGEYARIPEIKYGGQLSAVMRRMIRFSTSKAAVVTAGSQWLADKTPFPTEVIPLGVDVSLFKLGGEKQSLTGRPVLLHVGSLSPVKNQAMLLKTMAQVKETLPDAHLHMVGGGPELERLRNLASELNLEAHITFHGGVLHHDLPAFYRAVDMCLLKSHYESQSMVALEAAACGKITLGTHVGILPQLISDEFLVETGNHDKLAQMVVQLWNDQSRLQQISEQVYRRVSENFTLEHQIERWLDLYESVQR